MSKIDNYLNIEKEERDAAIFRVMPLQRLRGILETKKLTLVCPQYWQEEDPLENYIMEREYIFLDTAANIGYKNRFHCQSWSLEEESKKIWEKRSIDKTGAKVKTTIRKLFQSLWSTRDNPNLQDRECFIGQIDYKTLSEIKELEEFYRQNPIQCFTDPDMILPALSLLVKEDGKFSHEKEIRLMYYDMENKCAEGLFRYEINPNSIFEEIVFDPRMNKGKYKEIEKELKEKFGFIHPIRQSDLDIAFL